MIMKPQHRFLPCALAGFVVASAARRVQRRLQLDRALPSPSAPQTARVPAPAPSSTEFFTGITPNSNPHGIAPGPGGMWFTQSRHRIRSGGSARPASLPSSPRPRRARTKSSKAPTAACGLRTGADAIGRMTRTGRVTHVRHRQRGVRTVGHYSRLGRQRLVYVTVAQHERDRPHNDGGRGDALYQRALAGRRRRARHNHRTRRKRLVHRRVRQSHRPDHALRRHHRVLQRHYRKRGTRRHHAPAPTATCGSRRTPRIKSDE